MSVNISAGIPGYTSDPYSEPDISLNKFLHNMSDDNKKELKGILETIEDKGRDADLASIVGKASDSLKEAFTKKDLDLAKFLEGTKTAVAEDRGKLPAPPPPQDQVNAVTTTLSQTALFTNIVSALSTDDQTAIQKILDKVDMGATNVTELTSGVSDDAKTMFTDSGIDLNSFVTGLIDKQQLSDYSSSFGKRGRKTATVSDMVELLDTDKQA
jgi:hypothetical protein